MENNITKEFFPSSNLNNMSFFLYFSTYSDEEKEEISDIILKNKGVGQIIILYFIIYIFRILYHL